MTRDGVNKGDAEGDEAVRLEVYPFWHTRWNRQCESFDSYDSDQPETIVEVVVAKLIWKMNSE